MEKIKIKRKNSFLIIDTLSLIIYLLIALGILVPITLVLYNNHNNNHILQNTTLMASTYTDTCLGISALCGLLMFLSTIIERYTFSKYNTSIKNKRAPAIKSKIEKTGLEKRVEQRSSLRTKMSRENERAANKHK